MVSVQESAAELRLQAGWKQTEETGTILGFFAASSAQAQICKS